jgi:hypothetical protein
VCFPLWLMYATDMVNLYVNRRLERNTESEDGLHQHDRVALHRSGAPKLLPKIGPTSQAGCSPLFQKGTQQLHPSAEGVLVSAHDMFQR